MQKPLLTLTLALLATYALAQKNTPGYLITLQNDTVQGTLVNQGGYQLSHAITFMADGASQSKTYTPGEVNGFGIGSGLVYESMDLTATFVGAKLFAKQVLKGYASLYETLPLRGKPVYILQKPDGTLVALEEKVYFGLLKIHLGDCSTIRFDEKDLGLYRYRESNLAQLLTRYNTCLAPQTSQVRSRNQFPFNYGMLLGTSLNHYQNVNADASGDYGHNISPNVGAFVGFSIGRIAEVEWQLLYNHSSGQFLKGVNPMYGEEHYHFQIHYLTSPLLARFFLFDKLYLSPGLVLNKAISQSGSQFVYVKDYPFVADPNTFSVGYMAGLGTRFRLSGKTASLEARYQVSQVRRAYYPEASLTCVQLLLRMNLAKPTR